MKLAKRAKGRRPSTSTADSQSLDLGFWPTDKRPGGTQLPPISSPERIQKTYADQPKANVALITPLPESRWRSDSRRPPKRFLGRQTAAEIRARWILLSRKVGRRRTRRPGRDVMPRHHRLLSPKLRGVFVSNPIMAKGAAESGWSSTKTNKNRRTRSISSSSARTTSSSKFPAGTARSQPSFVQDPFPLWVVTMASRSRLRRLKGRTGAGQCRYWRNRHHQGPNMNSAHFAGTPQPEKSSDRGPGGRP